MRTPQEFFDEFIAPHADEPHCMPKDREKILRELMAYGEAWRGVGMLDAVNVIAPSRALNGKFRDAVEIVIKWGSKLKDPI